MSNTRLNKERYAVHSRFHHVTGRNMGDHRTVTIEAADLLEKSSNFVWNNGAFRVTLKNVPDMRSKTFYGETAWSDAARYAADAATKCGDWRWWPDL